MGTMEGAAGHRETIHSELAFHSSWVSIGLFCFFLVRSAASENVEENVQIQTKEKVIYKNTSLRSLEVFFFDICCKREMHKLGDGKTIVNWAVM